MIIFRFSRNGGGNCHSGGNSDEQKHGKYKLAYDHGQFSEENITKISILSLYGQFSILSLIEEPIW